MHIHLGALSTFFVSPELGQLLLELHDTLAFLPMAVLRSIPVTLLAGFAAVAVGLASLAEFAAGGVQWDAADLAGLSEDTKVVLDVRQIVRLNQLLSISQPERQTHPKFCLCESIQLNATV